MTPLNLDSTLDIFEKISTKVAPNTELMLIGAVPCMFWGNGISLLGGSRTTMDIDVWEEGSTFNTANLKAALKSVNVGFNPTGFDEPDAPYLQIVTSEMVFVPAGNPVELYEINNLRLITPDPYSYIASKLIRCNIKDAADCALIAKHHRIASADLIKAATKLKSCKRITRTQVELAHENITLIQSFLSNL